MSSSFKNGKSGFTSNLRPCGTQLLVAIRGALKLELLQVVEDGEDGAWGGIRCSRFNQWETCRQTKAFHGENSLYMLWWPEAVAALCPLVITRQMLA